MALIPPVSTITVGGVQLLLNGLIVLKGVVNNAASGLNACPRKLGVGSGYTPSGSKNFRIYAISGRGFNASGTIEIIYADNDVGIATNTAFVNLVYPVGANNISAAVFNLGATTNDTNETGFHFIIPNGKYIGIVGGGSASVTIFGYEE